MKLHINKRFRTIIITKKMILAVICVLIITLTSIFYFIYKSKKINTTNQYTSTDDFHNMIISETLPTKESEKVKLTKIVNELLGFDITKPHTIFHSASAQFFEVKEYANQSEIVLPQKEEKKSETKVPVQEKPIEEIKISKGLSVSNGTNIKVNTSEFLKSPLSYSLSDDGPQILIVHTHTTESYTDSGKVKYTTTDNDRSTDDEKNMIAVGRALAEVLNSNGIKTIHDTTVHDYPAYNGSYERCKATVLKNLEKYPSIKIVLDVHRDGIVREDGTMVKVSCEVDGNKTAQCMFVVGTNSELTHNNWQENLKLAAKIQNKANEMYPDFMRPINLRSERFNQQLSKGSIIIEVGSNGNTLNEAVYSAKLMGNVIASLFGK